MILILSHTKNSAQKLHNLKNFNFCQHGNDIISAILISATKNYPTQK